MELALVVVVVAFALGFDYTNGFHDAANAIAISITTRALSPRTALVMAADSTSSVRCWTHVAMTIGEEIISIDAERLPDGLSSSCPR